MKSRFITLFLALGATSSTAATPCAVDKVCAQTQIIEGHGFSNAAPTLEIASDEHHTIGIGTIKVSPPATEDQDGDLVDMLKVEYHWCVNAENYCFPQKNRELTIAPDQIDKVFTKGVGFKALSVSYSGEMQKGYPESTRRFQSDPLPVALEYPADFTNGICYEAGNQAVTQMVINTDALEGETHTHNLEFPNMALGSLPGELSKTATSGGINITDVANNFIPTFQEKALPEHLTVRYCHDACREWVEFEATKIPTGGQGAPTIYQADNIGKVSDGISLSEFNFQIKAKPGKDYRTNMVHCTQF
ncbi:hypothetical protein [Vibrio sagamiensis]|uniref:Uncharacterized protein n=1 Tax=Vibrio sagamiensis NBRC 104589 TaxID=1219064 RepID=A0A511QGB9_9VIBR|nr:hypothetical protein [Vibrio sagamiensis]PNQ57682.1 hypothetical protein C1141_13490 [Vibrio agarivorans]GEM76321.1 hypothetical protein VSA01S_24330 [Vibrio sagamiensis NBRC 104589]